MYRLIAFSNMKRVFFKRIEAAANQSGAMETETILKNGASSKSRMSRVNYAFLIVLFSMVFCIILASCSSPESDGIKAAKEVCNCDNDRYKNGKKALETYINNFHSYSFKTRIEARAKLKEFINETDKDYQECLKKADEYRLKLESTYLTNEEKKEKFNYAFKAHKDFLWEQRMSKLVKENISDVDVDIESLIKSIIPPKPDLELLKNDLIGNMITSEYLYFESSSSHLAWKIKSLNELKDVEILNIIDTDEDYSVDLQLRIQGDVNQIDAIINIKYKLGNDPEWRKTEFSTKSMDILRTGKYEGCLEKLKSFGHISFKNNCGVDLVIFGVYKNGKTFATELKHHCVDGHAPQGEYDILFIEQKNGFSWN